MRRDERAEVERARAEHDAAFPKPVDPDVTAWLELCAGPEQEDERLTYSLSQQIEDGRRWGKTL